MRTEEAKVTPISFVRTRSEHGTLIRHSSSWGHAACPEQCCDVGKVSFRFAYVRYKISLVSHVSKHGSWSCEFISSLQLFLLFLLACQLGYESTDMEQRISKLPFPNVYKRRDIFLFFFGHGLLKVYRCYPNSSIPAAFIFHFRFWIFHFRFLSSCWLSIEDGLIWAFIGPALLVIAINLLILILVVRIIIVSAGNLPHCNDPRFTTQAW
jgi:hypothetical protein